MVPFIPFIKKHQLIEPSSTILAGVSGGPDSLSLLHMLLRIREEWNLNVIVLHVDHMFRGKESEEEMEFVRSFCLKNNVRFEGIQADAGAYARLHHMGSQEAARECRYQFFEQMMKRYNGSSLVLGHHGDDQIETILMRLVRGGKGKSLAGIQPKREFAGGYIVRPLLGMSRQEIMDYCRKEGLSPRFDPSNEKDSYTRNRFRKRVLPFLKEENPRVHEKFQSFSENLSEDEEYLQELTERGMNTVWRSGHGFAELEIDLLKRLPLPLQRRGIQLILNYLYKSVPSSLSSIHTESVLSLLSQSHPSGSLHLPNGLKAVKSYNLCMFTFEHEEKDPYLLELPVPGEITLPDGGRLTAQLVKEMPDAHLGKNSLLIKRDQVLLPFSVRSRKNGDKLKVKGMNGTKKVKDIFIDKKIAIEARNQWPVLEDANGTILWLPGLTKSAWEENEWSEDEFIFLQYHQQGSSRGQNKHDETGY
ncbi:tRNA lysidine(34) synthetase TilS [Bacillus sp. FJAT-42376]|uniref:tRNA lysidine(34) synthetase TilS n=1 Tax=Bacillus sp. FJAT-42376 TaxID=2014076 RepID=UPI001F14EA51|nr:tRNA lysidine(34) synthetase TilS [Bacillus sp. FJAT-42376]